MTPSLNEKGFGQSGSIAVGGAAQWIELLDYCN